MALRSQLCSRIMQVQVRREYGWRDTRIYNGRGLPRRIVVVWKSLGNAISSLSLSLCSHSITRFVACPSQKSPPPGKDLHTRKSFPIRSEMTLDLFVPRLDHAEAKMIFLTRIAKISSSSSFRKIPSRILSFVQPIRLIEVVEKKKEEKKLDSFLRPYIRGEI